MGIVLVVVALLERIVFDLGPNIELVTVASVMAGIYMSGRSRLVVPLVIMSISDLFLGFSWISIFTWSGFMLMAILPKIMKKEFKSKLGLGLGVSVIGNILFYLWTNFGVWATDRWGMYSNDIGGLINSLLMGIPFFKNQLLSSLIFVPLFMGLYELYLYWRGSGVGELEKTI